MTSNLILFSNVVTKANNKKGKLITRINPTPTSANIGFEEPIKLRPAARLTKITPIQASICMYMSPKVKSHLIEYLGFCVINLIIT